MSVCITASSIRGSSRRSRNQSHCATLSDAPCIRPLQSGSCIALLPSTWGVRFRSWHTRPRLQKVTSCSSTCALGLNLYGFQLFSVDQQAPAKTFCRMRHVDLAMTRSWPSSAGTIAASPSSSPVCESPMEPSGYSDIPDFQASNKG